MTEKYQSVNGQWPDNLPVPTEQEAAAAVKRLYRLVMKRPLRNRIKITSGRRRTRMLRGIMYVNPNYDWPGFGGWKGMVHSLSHHCHRKLFPRHHPHDGRGTHAWIERQMIEHVVNSGWLGGKLRRKPKARVDAKAVRHQRVLTSIKRWQTKLKRAETALKKLRRQARYYERSVLPQKASGAIEQSIPV